MISDLMTRLWVEHVAWTRQVIVSSLANLPDLQTATSRLMRNQDDLGRTFGHFYGASFGNTAAALLRQHIQISIKLVGAAAAGNTGEAARQDALWHQNAIQIAKALASVNPYWSEGTLQTMLFQHLAVTRAEATSRIQKNWSTDVAAFDSVIAQALSMANGLAAGISRQFPGA